ncbi:MAG: zf-HC2 domain-containing protein [Myxococcales bacterium]
MTETGHLSTLKLNARALGQLSPGDLGGADAHLEGCERCRALAAELAADDDRFRREVFPRTLPRIEARAARGRWGRGARWGWIWAPAVALAALPVALLVLRTSAPRPDLEPKGGPVFQLFARRGVQVFAVEPGSRLQPGDQLRFVVDPGELDHVLVASRDGAGKLSVYYPFGAVASGAVTPTTRSELPGSVTLDGTLGDERLWAVFSRRPLSSEEVLQALSSPDSRGVPGADSVLELSFRKALP